MYIIYLFIFTMFSYLFFSFLPVERLIMLKLPKTKVNS